MFTDDDLIELMLTRDNPRKRNMCDRSADLEAALCATLREGYASDTKASEDEENNISSKDIVRREEGLRRDVLSLLESLSPRELTVVEHLTRGYSLSEIETSLGLAPRVAEIYRRKAFGKLGAQSESELVWFGIYGGLDFNG